MALPKGAPDYDEKWRRMHKAMLDLNDKGPADEALVLANINYPKWAAGIFDGDGSVVLEQDVGDGNAYLRLELTQAKSPALL